MVSHLIRSHSAALATFAVTLSLFPFACTASAKTLAGIWAPFNRCPVDSVAMFEANGESSVAACGTMEAPNGSLTIGHFSAPFTDVDAQFGLVVAGEVFSTISPADGVLSSAPIQVPGGLQAMCADQHGVVSNVCALASKHVRLNEVYAQLESVGPPSNLNLDGAFTTEVPLVSLPARIHLINPLLGPDCAIGTEKEPIVLAPVNTAQAELSEEWFEPNGTPVENGALVKLEVHGASKADTTFAVPGVHGCGALASFDKALDHAFGLPSPSGANSLVLENASVALALLAAPSAVVPNDGRDLAKAWHSAVVH